MEVSCATDKINMIISCRNIFADSLSNHASPATYASLINNDVCRSCRILASAASLVCFIRPTDEIFRWKKGSAAYQARPYLNFIRFSSVSFSFSPYPSAIPRGGGHSTRPSGDNSTDHHSNSLQISNNSQRLCFCAAPVFTITTLMFDRDLCK